MIAQEPLVLTLRETLLEPKLQILPYHYSDNAIKMLSLISSTFINKHIFQVLNTKSTWFKSSKVGLSQAGFSIMTF